MSNQSAINYFHYTKYLNKIVYIWYCEISQSCLHRSLKICLMLNITKWHQQIQQLCCISQANQYYKPIVQSHVIPQNKEGVAHSRTRVFLRGVTVLTLTNLVGGVQKAHSFIIQHFTALRPSCTSVVFAISEGRYPDLLDADIIRCDVQGQRVICGLCDAENQSRMTIHFRPLHHWLCAVVSFPINV